MGSPKFSSRSAFRGLAKVAFVVASISLLPARIVAVESLSDNRRR